MDVHIETRNFLFNEWYELKCRGLIRRMLSKYGFINDIHISLNPSNKGIYKVKTLISAKNSNIMVSESASENAIIATKSSLQKIRKNLDKYKATHYHK